MVLLCSVSMRKPHFWTKELRNTTFLIELKDSIEIKQTMKMLLIFRIFP